MGKHAVNHSGDLRTVCGAGCHGGVEANLLLLPRGIERGEVIGIVGRGDLRPGDRTIDVLIGRLRKKIEADPARPDFLLTRAGEGYCFVNSAAP